MIWLLTLPSRIHYRTPGIVVWDEIVHHGWLQLPRTVGNSNSYMSGVVDPWAVSYFKTFLEPSFNRILHANMLNRMFKTCCQHNTQLFSWLAYQLYMLPNGNMYLCVVVGARKLVDRCLARYTSWNSFYRWILVMHIESRELPSLAGIQNMFSCVLWRIAALTAAWRD